MTERELFRRFYWIARIDARYDVDYADDARFDITHDAVHAGFSGYHILRVRNAAQLAILARKQQHREPSKNSTAIQCVVHTFGRVRRDFA